MPLAHASIPLGIVVRRTPGVTRWAKWAWSVAGILPGAGPARWQELRREGEAAEYHAATLPLELWSSDTDAYLEMLNGNPPSVCVILHEDSAPGARMPWRPALVTVSAHDTLNCGDAEGYLIELVPMPPSLIAWVRDFVAAHHRETPFVKRQRDSKHVERPAAGRGDARVRQLADVYRAPGASFVEVPE
ncbi:DUF3305 domain-containing protein [Albidovulum sp.]